MLLSIGEFSKLAKTTVRTLRFYDEIGLFKPTFIEENGYRYYSVEDLEKVSQIIELRKFGLSLDEIKSIVVAGNDVQTILENRLKTLEQQVESERNNISLIQKKLKELQGEEKMSDYKATEMQLPSYTVYYRHGVIKDMSCLTDFVLQAGEECRKNNPTLKCSDDYCYVTYEAEEYRETDVELEYVEAVESFGKESENIGFKTVPAIKAICIEHKGSYEKLGEAYAFALAYVKQNGYTICDKIREVYVHGCWDCENTDDYLTIIQVPVK